MRVCESKNGDVHRSRGDGSTLEARAVGGARRKRRVLDVGTANETKAVVSVALGTLDKASVGGGGGTSDEDSGELHVAWSRD